MNMITSLHIVIPTLITIILIFSCMCIIRTMRNSIKVWLLAQPWIKIFLSEGFIDQDKKYDVFISYSHHNAEYVEKVLWPGLETPGDPTKPAYKCKVHTRDFQPGEMIPNQIVQSVKESRRTLILLSKEYVLGDWTRLEFQEAHQSSLNDNRQVSI